jgi:hypothetical protein
LSELDKNLYFVFERVIVAQRQLSNFSAISWREQVNFQGDDNDIYFVLDQHAWLDFHSASFTETSPQIDMWRHSDIFSRFFALSP